MTSLSKYERPALSQRRVVVTGIGALTPLGLDLATTWEALKNGKSGIQNITSFDSTQYDVHFAGEVNGFDPSAFIEKKEQKKMDRFIQLAVAAGQMAMADSGLVIDETLSLRAGALVGVGIGGLPAIETQFKVILERGPSRVTPFFIPMVISNLASGHLSMKYHLKGPNYAVTSACASGANAIGDAAKYIRDGICDVMLAGGSEAAVCPLAMSGFAAMKALSTRNDQPTIASRPFDRDRDGFVMSEAASILVLEDFEHASRRGAKIYGELVGYGVSSDAHHLTNPAPGGEGATRAMAMALRDARLNPEQIQYVNAHGTSTPVGDGLETQGIHNVFREHARKLWVSSTKSMTGHSLGAAGAIESAFSLMTLSTHIAPPTINLDHPSDDCDLDYVPHVAREGKMTAVMNNSFGFGGTNASLVFASV